MEKERLTNSPFMSPKVFKTLLSILQQKESSLINTPAKESAHRYLKLYSQRGIYTMFSQFKAEYIYILKMYNMFEQVINYLATMASSNKTAPEESLPSVTLQSVQASELHTSATHINASTG